MKRLVPLVALLAITSSVCAQDAKTVPREFLRTIVDDEPNPLPRYMTLEEQRLPLPVAADRGSPPLGTIYTPPEYDFNSGLLIRWGSYNALLTELTVGVTTGDPDAMVYILVSGASQESSASSTLASAGANMDQVEFITYTANSVWIRDYGPRFIFEDNSRAIVDHTYNRPSRPLDNAFPDYLSGLWDEPHYDLPLTHGGGNFHLFANRDAFMSDLILTENPAQSEQDVVNYFAQYENLDLTIYQGLPTYFDSTQHIDMWMLPVGDYEIIIGEYESSTGLPYTITEGAVADLLARGYTVYRTPGWNSGGTHYTYTNAVVFNDLVFISEFGGSYAGQDAQALAVFQEAYPNHQIIQTDCASIIHAAGAIHCIVMHVPGYSSTLRVTPGSGLLAQGPVGGPFLPDSVVYTLENTSEVMVDYSVTKSADWLTVSNATGSIAAGMTTDVMVSINSAADVLGIGVYNDSVAFVNLTDHSGDTARPVELTVGIPEPVHVFDMNTAPGWSMAGEWSFGRPLGGGGTQYGFPDPDGGATGINACGVNLLGDYATVPGGPYYLQTEAVDCSNLQQTSLRFQRWLNSDYQPYVYATLEVSNDGADWVMLWQNGATEITENAWSEQTHDISAFADDQPTVYIRWGYEVGSGAYAYSGWNLDDVEIWALLPAECAADLNADGNVNIVDLLEVLASWGVCPDCAADGNGDGVVDIVDLLGVLAAWGPC